MRHRVLGKQLSRTTSHRKALRRNMASSLIQHGAIRTTEAKAKELRPFIEKLITIARQGTLHARRRVVKILQDREMFNFDEAEKDYVPDDKTVIQKLFDDIAPRYADRPGGYTRIIRLADRRIGDGGVQVVLQLIEESAGKSEDRLDGRRKQRAAKRHAAVGELDSPAEEASAETEENAEVAASEVADESPETTKTPETEENGEPDKPDAAE